MQSVDFSRARQQTFRPAGHQEVLQVIDGDGGETGQGEWKQNMLWPVVKGAIFVEWECRSLSTPFKFFFIHWDTKLPFN